jgi:hypothetical protein
LTCSKPAFNYAKFMHSQTGSEGSPNETWFIELKDWRNSVKHVANIVSYLMKSSSQLINVYAYFIKQVIKEPDRRGLLKLRSVKFSEQIFARHK